MSCVGIPDAGNSSHQHSQDIDAIREEPAIEELHQIFYEVDQFPRPPRIHWGVVLPRERVLEIAAQNNMTIYLRHKGQNTDIEEDVTFDYVLPRLAKHFGLDPATITTETPANPTYGPWIISFGTNYTFVKNFKFFDDLQNFFDFLEALEITEDPKWYVCSSRRWIAQDDRMAKWPL
jgi:hypothetical protein